jgi:pantoate--beta-alanine ligase
LVTITDVMQLAGRDGGIFVPTMGALHEGHGSLIREAARRRDAETAAGGRRRDVVVSIFVNRTQFNDPADFARYPKTLDADLAICQECGADAVFVPEHETVYPPGQVVAVPDLPAAARLPRLEDALRPGHFEGVCQVVRRLFAMVRPARAIFGEKDWQQLAVIAAMTTELGLGIEIIPGPTIREADGLAMSSRNRFLTSAERVTAGALWRALRAAGAEATPERGEAAMAEVLQAAGLEIQYAVVRDAATLGPVASGRPARALIACRLGAVRLIDNAPWPMG